MPMRNSLLVLDLDGTLLNRSQQISRKNEQALRTFMEAGGKVTLATGRMEAAALPYARQLGLHLPLILYNGARLFCSQRMEAVWEQHAALPASLLGELLELHGPAAAVLFYNGQDVFVKSINVLVEGYMDKEQVLAKQLTREIWQGPLLKVLVIAASSACAEQIAAAASRYPEVKVTSSESNYVEILGAGVGKGPALRQLLKKLDMADHTVIAAGDQLNDVCLLEAADLSFAMANAHPKLKEKADQIALHHDLDAVADIIHKLSKQH